jgi:drug/metabolite transporter (DMT)-like permease
MTRALPALLTVMAAASWTAATVLTKVALRELVAAALFVASADREHLLAAVATGLLGGAVPVLAFNLAIRDLPVAQARLILNLIPVLAAGGAVAVLGERLRWPEIVGGVLVVSAAAAAAPLDGTSPDDVRPPRESCQACAGGSVSYAASGSR